MSTGEANASWHPAWMPNTLQEDSSAIHHESTKLETAVEPREEPTEITIASHKSLDPIDTQTSLESQDDVDHDPQSATNNENHPELNSLRNALTTSLASPGGVEMDESPVHTEESSSGPAEETNEHPEAEMPEKAEFPSRGPAQELGHTSNDSFTRTKVDDINWGEDDEVDPEWNLHRTDTDPFKFMGKSDRTNSFPQVPPAHTPPVIQADHALAHSQAEAVIQEIEQQRDPFAEDDPAEDDFFAQQADSMDPVREATESGQDDFSSHTGQDTINDDGRTLGGDAVDEESDDRYEEGLPLVPHEEQHDEIPQQPSVEVSAFADDNGADDDDFFSGIGQSNQEPRSELNAPPTLDRKSTMQVMDSMKFEAHENDDDDDNDPDEIVEEPEKEAEGSKRETEEFEEVEKTEKPEEVEQTEKLEEIEQTEEPEEVEKTEEPEEKPEERGERRLSSFDLSTGGGIAGSMSTVASQVLGDPEGNLHEDSSAPSEADLAAKWKAALEADELLDDDDELLPDDDEEPGEKALDPATFFGSDDEGFLEDDDQLPATSTQNLSSSPVPAPVYDSNGQLMGYDNITTRNGSANNASTANRYLPQNATPGSGQQQPVNNYTPTAPFLTDLSGASRPGMLQPGKAQSYGFPSAATPPTNLAFPPPQQETRPPMPKAQSFVNQSKGGYSSPYDLPMDVVKVAPRKKQSMQHMARTNSNTMPPPPPRSASMTHQESTSMSGPVPSASPVQGHLPPAAASSSKPPSLKSKGSFFEELPMTAKPRPSGRYTPQPSQTSSMPPTAGVPQQFPSVPPQASQPPPSRSIVPNPYSAPPPAQAGPPAVQGLVAPPRVNPYASIAAGTVPNAPPPVTAQRYSPAPPTNNLSAPPPPSGRYSPAPPVHRPAMPGQHATAPVGIPPSVMAHQPRTSSPLAYFEKSQRPPSAGGVPERRPGSLSQESTHSYSGQGLPPTQESDEYPGNQRRSLDQQPRRSSYAPSQSQTHPPTQGGDYTPPPPSMGASLQASPAKRATTSYLPQQSLSYGQEPQDAQTRRAHSQSPVVPMNGQSLGLNTIDPYQRSLSAQAMSPSSPTANTAMFSPITAAMSHRRAPSKPLNYIAPTDGREQDQMQRWKGYPIFNWGAGGTVVTSFPKEVPRYTIGQIAPMITCSPGEVKTRSIKDLFPLPERLSGFPGPLKGKSAKKQVVAWLSTGIDHLEKEFAHLASTTHMSHENKRNEERLLLWKILRVFIENDGILEGNSTVDQAVRAIISPGLDAATQDQDPLYATDAGLPGMVASAATETRTDARDPASVDQLRKFLLRGDREKAVWEAVDKRLWAHAMLIANTVSVDLYKQVAQEFVQKEVKSIGENTESLAALYEIFAGNFEESIDELVPPSARAGFQMVSTSTSTATTKSALDGLDRWRETLGLVLSNRSNGDNQALNALGKLLASYNRAEAAHICFIFGRMHSVFSGIDDPASNIVLVGADHTKHLTDFSKELEPILLSEVYEYGLSLSNTVLSIPHLSAYKLQHATILAEYGYRDNALQYCEAVAGSMTSQTRRSPYHNPLLVASLDDLSKRLKQSPKDENSSWISKPSIDKVSGSVWAKFANFVAGDETDTTNGAGGDTGSEVGPFSRIAGETPTISRSPSTADFGSYPGATPIPASGIASRYAPNATSGPYQPQSYEPPMSSSYSSQPRRSLERTPNDFQRGSYEPQRHSSEQYRPGSQASSYTGNSYMPQAQQSPQQHQTGPKPYAPQEGSTFESAPLFNPASQPMTPATEAPQNSFYGSPLSHLAQPPRAYESPEQNKEAASFGASEPPAASGYEPPTSSYEPPAPSSYEPPTSSYEPPAPSSYEPPVSTGYEPPASTGYEPPASTGYEPPASTGYEPPASTGYEPPASNGYEPPSYEPVSFNEEPDSPIDTKPKKKSFMDDDDDDDIPALKNLKKPAEKTKAEKDREADEAFRKAAEEDAKRAAAAPAKKGWGLGGWFAKKEPAPEASQPGKPIRAKLGEQSSFVYDPELKRWINKKDKGAATPAPSATPPPPKGGPARNAPPRSATGPPSNAGLAMPPPARSSSTTGSAPPLQRADSPLASASPDVGSPIAESPSAPGGAAMAAPPLLRNSTSNMSLGPPSGPPSRPTTSMSNASSIDDLLGAPVARKGAAKQKKKGRGYVDVMAK